MGKQVTRLYVVSLAYSKGCVMQNAYHQLESRFPGEISSTQICTWYHSSSEEELKSFLIKVKEESEKAGLKLNIQKTKIMASGTITSWQIEREKMGRVTDFIGLQNYCG